MLRHRRRPPVFDLLIKPSPVGQIEIPHAEVGARRNLFKASASTAAVARCNRKL